MDIEERIEELESIVRQRLHEKSREIPLTPEARAVLDAVREFCECHVNEEDMRPGGLGAVTRCEIRRRSLQSKMEYAWLAYARSLEGGGEKKKSDTDARRALIHKKICESPPGSVVHITRKEFEEAVVSMVDVSTDCRKVPGAGDEETHRVITQAFADADTRDALVEAALNEVVLNLCNNFGNSPLISNDGHHAVETFLEKAVAYRRALTGAKDIPPRFEPGDSFVDRACPERSFIVRSASGAKGGE